MQDHHIWVSKSDRLAPLATEPAYRPENLAHWTGVRIVRYRMPAEVHDRHVRADHPILTLMCQGRASARLRMGLDDSSTEYRAFDMMCYSGRREITSAQWKASEATLISVELDPARLVAVDGGDARFARDTLDGTPRFTDPDLAALILALWKEVHAGCPQGKLFTDSLTLGLAAYAHRRFGRLADDRREAGAVLAVAQLRRVEDYIRIHLADSIGLADLAREAGLSRYHFCRLFQNTVGRSPYQHVLRERLIRAHTLLSGTSLSIAEVALAVGFSSQSHFAAVCRRVLGRSPRELREQR
ncbi:helix-turn-helix transcriptional regulator [Rhizobacter sp. LjRoot28]|uniref:helix-turn-helix transcriptional regulator n=1 Tax=Rhizobacter sp. LjRoot28 TaxID=3342309 RepID=UPI003ECC8D71